MSSGITSDRGLSAQNGAVVLDFAAEREAVPGEGKRPGPAIEKDLTLESHGGVLIVRSHRGRAGKVNDRTRIGGLWLAGILPVGGISPVAGGSATRPDWIHGSLRKGDMSGKKEGEEGGGASRKSDPGKARFVHYINGSYRVDSNFRAQ